jgi:hypothetical protein
MRQHPNPVEGVRYVGFPWARLIDHLNNGTPKGRALLSTLDRLLPHLQAPPGGSRCAEPSSLAGQPGALIHGNDGWFYEDPVYGVQITGRIGAEDPRATGPRQLWDDAVFLLPDNAQGVMAIPQLTKQWAADPDLLAAKRAGLHRLWQRYSPDTFITDILALIDGLRE